MTREHAAGALAVLCAAVAIAAGVAVLGALMGLVVR
jgi:hypothetical protein